MKKIIFGILALATISTFAQTAPHVIATYTDFYNDDDLIGECLVFGDGTAMLMSDNIVPYYKPESFTLKTSDVKKLEAALQIEALGKIDSKSETCNQAIAPFAILGNLALSKIDVPYITGEAQKEFSSNSPDCWIRMKRDHVELSKSSETAKILKRVCGFVGQ